jgi:hypothetical protein
MNYMGIDHHKQYLHITLMDEKGKKLRSGRVANYRTELEKFLDGNQQKNSECQENSLIFQRVGRIKAVSYQFTPTFFTSHKRPKTSETRMHYTMCYVLAFILNSIFQFRQILLFFYFLSFYL